MTKDSTRKWLFALILGVLIWSFLFFTRAYWYQPWCAVTPSPCVIDQVNFFDRIVFQFGNVQADFWSNVIQNFTGIFVFLLPWLIWSRKIALEETLINGTAAFANLSVLEITRALVQRPRPLVFNSVMGDGANIQQYTSFYSGHTSFVALASLCFFFMIRRRYPKISQANLTRIVAVYTLLSFLTGLLRILGGRHYPTDVMFGFLMGTFIAIVTNKCVDASRQ